MCMQSFNPRARVGRDRLHSRRSATPTKFQSTRPRGARRHNLGTGIIYSEVSIHAPAWGATSRAKRASKIACVSIHAPAWGATKMFHKEDENE